MSDSTEQKVIAVCDFSEQMKDVIVHAARIADILKKELCLLALWQKTAERELIHQNMAATSRTLKKNLSGLQISSLVIKGTLRENMLKLAKDYNTVLVVLHQSEIKKSLPAFRESYVAFLYVNGGEAENLTYRNVLVPLDYRKASKESALWASYLGRFNRSEVLVVHAHESNSDQAKQISKSMTFMQKLFHNLNVSHRFIAGKSSSWGIFKETLSISAAVDGNVMIFAGSTYISLIDRIIGLPEQKIVSRAGRLPVLLINPKREACVLCD